MILEKIADCLQKYIWPQGVFEQLLNFVLCFSLQNSCLFLEHDADTIQRQYVQWLASDYSVKQKEELLDLDVVDETIENPREYQSQGLNV